MNNDPRFPRVVPIPGQVPWNGPGMQNSPRVGAIRNTVESVSRPSLVGGPSTDSGVFELHRYAKLNGEILFPCSTVSGLAAAAPTTYRNMLLLRNTDATDTIFVAFGSDATLQSVLALEPGVQVLFDTVVPQDDIFAIASANAPILAVAFSTINLPV